MKLDRYTEKAQAAIIAAQRLATDAPAIWRAVILRGEGPVFSAGIDLGAFNRELN